MVFLSLLLFLDFSGIVLIIHLAESLFQLDKVCMLLLLHLASLDCILLKSF